VLVAATVASVLVIAPLPAHADGATQFVYSPIACQTFGGALWIYTSGQISNKSTTEPMRVFCPLIHEARFGDTQKTQVHVVQANQHHKDESGKVMRVKCRVFFNHPHANSDPKWASTSWQGQSASSNGVETATITLPGHEYLGGSIMLECLIPPRDPLGINQALYNGESRIGTYKSGVD
jgi:hypothetical protein